MWRLQRRYPNSQAYNMIRICEEKQSTYKLIFTYYDGKQIFALQYKLSDQREILISKTCDTNGQYSSVGWA